MELGLRISEKSRMILSLSSPIAILSPGYESSILIVTVTLCPLILHSDSVAERGYYVMQLNWLSIGGLHSSGMFTMMRKPSYSGAGVSKETLCDVMSPTRSLPTSRRIGVISLPSAMVSESEFLT